MSIERAATWTEARDAIRNRVAIATQLHQHRHASRARVLTYNHPLRQASSGAFAARGGRLHIVDLDAAAKKVAASEGIAPDWLNSHIDTFTAVLPGDYSTRFRRVFIGTHLEVDA